MPIVLDGSLGVTTPMYNGTITANAVTPSVNMKNRIINGAMTIDQRNAGAAFGTSINGYTLDRWGVFTSVTGKLNGSQNYNSVTRPVGFTNYLGVQSQSAYSISSSDYFWIGQRIEGFNIADLGWGTANAKTVTLSFQVYSSLTGTFGGSILNNATDRSYPFTYTISSANTWTTISVTIAGDTSGTWLTNNGIGMYVVFGLGVGSTYSGTAGAWASAFYISATGATSVVGTNGATFYITGVQLEVGSTATSFDYRPYGTELALCQRYLPAFSCASGEKLSHFGTVSSSAGWATVPFQVPTRVSPTGITSNSNWVMSSFGTGSTPAGALTFNAGSQFSITVAATGASTFVAGQIGNLQASGGTATFYGTGCEL